jgi:hypothetical protein
MTTYFMEVLARETMSLAAVTDAASLGQWRSALVDELTTAQSPYAKVLRQEGELRDRAAFLDQWRDLIAAAVDRVVKSDPAARADADVQKTAMLILAALHGGSVLSRVAKDRRPLNAALDLALVPLPTPVDDALPGRDETVLSVPWTGDDFR